MLVIFVLDLLIFIDVCEHTFDKKLFLLGLGTRGGWATPSWTGPTTSTTGEDAASDYGGGEDHYNHHYKRWPL